jgi:hypothetical protein
VHGQAGSGEQRAKAKSHYTRRALTKKSRVETEPVRETEKGASERSKRKQYSRERAAGSGLRENNRTRTGLCMDGIHNREAGRKRRQGWEGRRSPRDLVRRDRRMCTSVLRMGASRRSGRAIRNRTMESGQSRASEARSLHREGLTWKLGYRRKRLPVRPNQKTGSWTW